MNDILNYGQHQSALPVHIANMTTQQSPTEPKSGTFTHVEDASIDTREIEKLGTVDKFGAHIKTDPKEIALVRKLDIYMLVRLFLQSSVVLRDNDLT